jgi:hypothetical protein
MSQTHLTNKIRSCIGSGHSVFVFELEVSGQRHFPVTLTPGKKSTVTIPKLVLKCIFAFVSDSDNRAY